MAFAVNTLRAIGRSVKGLERAFFGTRKPPQRVMCYIDGFNLYFGMRQAKLRRLYWLNVGLLSESLLRPGQRLVCTKYFTARISGALPRDTSLEGAERDAQRKRQSAYLDALMTLPDLEIFEGHFITKTEICPHCENERYRHEEKMTDVNIATEMLLDASQDKFDVALLISADSDLVPLILAVHQMFPAKKVVACFPPCRNSKALQKVVSGYRWINRRTLQACQLPDVCMTASGQHLERPAHWKPPAPPPSATRS